MSTTKPRPLPSNRPARAAVPPLQIFEMLDATHREVMHRLQRLRQVGGAVGRPGRSQSPAPPPTRSAASSTARPVRTIAAEERSCFPSLLDSDDAALVQHVLRLQQDHGWLEEDWLELQPQLRAVVEGFSGFDADFLRAAVPVFTELYRDHISLEETVVYPESRRRQA